MSRFIVLEDLSNRMRSFDLPHEVYCAAREQCSCRIAKGRRLWEDHKAGKRELRRKPIRICASITILARGHSEPVPEEVLKVPAIHDAVEKERSLRWAPYVDPVEPEPVEDEDKTDTKPSKDSGASSAPPDTTKATPPRSAKRKTTKKKATAKNRSADKTPSGGK